MPRPTRKEEFKSRVRSARMPIAAAIRAIDTAADYDRPQAVVDAVHRLETAIGVLVEAVKVRNGRIG